MTASPQLTAPIKTHDFGDIYSGEALQCTFEINNPTSETFKIKSIIGSCVCVQGRLNKDVLGPSEKALLTADIGTTQSQSRRVSQKLTLTWQSLKGITSHLSFRLIAMPVPVAEIEPADLDFGSINLRSKPVSRDLYVLHNSSWNRLLIIKDGQNIPIGSVSNGAYPVTIWFYPKKLSIGTYHQTIVIRCFNQSNQVGPELHVPMQAEVTGDVKAVPSAIYLGAVPPRKVSTGSFQIVPSSKSIPVFKSLSASGERGSSVQASLNESSTQGFRVRYAVLAPSTPGPISGRILVQFISGADSFSIKIPFLGYVIGNSQ